MKARNGQKPMGRGPIPAPLPNSEKGMAQPMTMMAPVRKSPGADTVPWMNGIFSVRIAALMNARSRFLGNKQPGFVPDLPPQLTNPFFKSPPQRRKLAKREGPIPYVNSSRRSSARSNMPSSS